MVNGMRRKATLALFSGASISLGSMTAARAQAPASTQTPAANRGGLYDPEPPPDSAYLRVVVIGGKAPWELLIDGKPRGARLLDGSVSDYLIVPHGRRTIGLSAAGSGGTTHRFSIDVPQGKAMTLAYDGLKPDSPPKVFEDRSNTNKLKAQLAAYHLDSKAGAVDVLTADGSTRVFTNLAYGASNSIQVNPISVQLTAARNGGDASRLLPGPASLSMTPGASYSLFLVPDGKGGLTARTLQNKTERFVAGRT